MKQLLVILFCFLSVSALAQEKYFYISLDVNKPLSNTSWIRDNSPHGFRAGYRGFINDKFSAGIDVGSVTLDQYSPSETFQNGNGAITTDYFKYVYSYSATISGQYNLTLGDGERFLPYVGLGLGANNNRYVMYYNIYENTDAAWGFLARPEAGMLVKLSRNGSFGLMAAIHYDYSTNKSDKFNYSNFSTLGFQIGIALIDR